MPENLSRLIHRWSRGVTLRPESDQILVLRKQLLEPIWISASASRDDAFTRGAAQKIFNIVSKIIRGPKGQRPHSRLGFVRALRNEAITNFKSMGQVLRQRTEEFFTCTTRRSFGDVTQGFFRAFAVRNVPDNNARFGNARVVLVKGARHFAEKLRAVLP